jgi:hypothetical protein
MQTGLGITGGGLGVSEGVTDRVLPGVLITDVYGLTVYALAERILIVLA